MQLISEILSLKSWFEQETPVEVVETKGLSSCSFENWLSFMKDHTPLLVKFVDGMKSKVCERALDEDQQVHVTMRLATSIANMIHLVCPNWKWTMGYLIQSHIRLKAHSQEVTDIFGEIFPGCYTDRQLCNIENDMLEDVLSRMDTINQKGAVLIEYDNWSHPFDFQKRARAGMSVDMPYCITATAMCAYIFEDCFLQYMPEKAPRNDLPYEAVADANVGIRDIPDPKNKEGKSDADYIKEMYYQQLREAMSKLLEDKSFVNEERGTRSRLTTQQQEADRTGLIKAEGYEKQCIGTFLGNPVDGCRKWNKNTRRKCKHCKAKLLSMPELKAIEQGKPAPAYVPKKRIAKRKRSDIESPHEPPPQKEVNVSGRLRPNKPVQEQLLKPVLVNPGSHAGSETVHTEARRVCNVDGHDESLPTRGWFFEGTDAGGVNLEKLFKGEYGDIFFIPGSGHFDMAATKAMLKLSRPLSGDEFIAAYGFSLTPKAIAHLMNGTDFHVSHDFLDIEHKTILTEMCKHYLLEVDPEDPMDMDRLVAWLEDDQRDEMWSNYVEFWVKIYGAYSCIRAGSRSKNYHLFNAGRRALLPLFFQLGMNHYGPLTLWDILRTDYRCDPEVRDFVMDILFHIGQGYDFDLEEKIKELKKARSKLGDKGYLCAAAVVFSMPELATVVLKNIGMEKRNSKARGVINRDRDLKEFGDVLSSYDTIKKVPGRCETTSVDGAVCLNKQISMKKLLEDGIVEISKARSVGLDKYKLPKAVKLFQGDDDDIIELSTGVPMDEADDS
jgi:hypothetical protein